MLSGVVIMITRLHCARDGAARLIMPVPDGRCRASVPGGCRPVATEDGAADPACQA
jgi:hypothetical protein